MDILSPEKNESPEVKEFEPPISLSKPTPASSNSTVTFDDPTVKNSSNGFPYFAGLITFVLLLLSALYSTMSLVNYVMDKWLVKPKQADSSGFSYLDFSSFETYAVVGAISALIITITALVIFIGIVRRSEEKEPWRASQKWRRIIYSTTAVVLILSLISTLIGLTFELLSTNLKLSELSYTAYSTEPKPDVAGETKAAISSAIVNAVIIIGVMATVFFEYANKYRKVIWGTVIGLVVIGSILSAVSIGHVNKTVQDVKKQNSSTEDPSSEYPYDTNDDYYYDSTTDQDSSSDSLED